MWLNLNSLAKRWEITIQWIPRHKDIEGNEAADKAAKEATTLSQEDAALDFTTMKAAIKRHFKKIWSEAVLARVGIYSEAKICRPPAQLRNVNRKDETTIHQLRTGTSPLVRGCWARYAQRPEAERLCPNGCNVVEDVRHLFWDCPHYVAQRMKNFGTPEPERNILFGEPRPILRYLENTGHSTMPTVPDDDAAEAAE